MTQNNQKKNNLLISFDAHIVEFDKISLETNNFKGTVLYQIFLKIFHLTTKIIHLSIKY